MKLTANSKVLIALLVVALAPVSTLPDESRPDATVAFHATFDSQGEAQEFLAAFFKRKKYKVRMSARDAADFLYARSPDRGDVVATGDIRSGIRTCILVDFQFASIDVDVRKRDPRARARALSEAEDLIEWLSSNGAENAKLHDFASRVEGPKCYQDVV